MGITGHVAQKAIEVSESTFMTCGGLLGRFARMYLNIQIDILLLAILADVSPLCFLPGFHSVLPTS